MASIPDARGISLQSFSILDQWGNIEEVVAVYHLTRLQTGTLFDPGAASGDSSVPQIGDQFDPDGSAAAVYNEVRCEEQETTCLGRQSDNNVVYEIKCTFRRWPLTPRVNAGGSGLQQIATQKLKDGSQILVSHNGRDQGGEIQVFKPTSGFEIEVIEPIGTNSSPYEKAQEWVGTVNKTAFAGAGARQWKIVDVSYSRRSVFPSAYMFVYRFENNVDGHDPTAVYVDPETGEIPPDLVLDEGIVTIKYDDEKDFGPLFDTRTI